MVMCRRSIAVLIMFTITPSRSVLSYISRQVRANRLGRLRIHARLSIPCRGQLAQAQTVPVADLILAGGPTHRPTGVQMSLQRTHCLGRPFGSITPQRKHPEALRIDGTDGPAQELGMVRLATELSHFT